MYIYIEMMHCRFAPFEVAGIFIIQAVYLRLNVMISFVVVADDEQPIYIAVVPMTFADLVLPFEDWLEA